MPPNPYQSPEEQGSPQQGRPVKPHLAVAPVRGSRRFTGFVLAALGFAVAAPIIVELIGNIGEPAGVPMVRALAWMFAGLACIAAGARLLRRR